MRLRWSLPESQGGDRAARAGSKPGDPLGGWPQLQRRVAQVEDMGGRPGPQGTSSGGPYPGLQSSLASELVKIGFRKAAGVGFGEGWAGPLKRWSCDLGISCSLAETGLGEVAFGDTWGVGG